MASLAEELECEADDDLTKDIASLKAALSENVASASPEREETGRECEAVTELQVCLYKNITLQNLLWAKLREIDAALQENAEKLCKVKEMTASRGSMKKGILALWRFKRGDYFKDYKGQTPPSLSGPSTSSDYLGTAVYSTELSWQTKRKNTEDRKLTEGVRRQVIDHLSQSLQNSLKLATNWEERSKLRKEIRSISTLSTVELLKEDFTVDWSLLAYEQFNNSRTAIDCELHWNGSGNPNINKSAWKKDEDKALIRVGREMSFRNWKAIAAELETNRTGFSCLQRYQQSLNPSMFRKTFTPEEDERLGEAVTFYGDSKWRMVSAYIGGKTPSQCMHRWNNTLNPDIKKGRWKKEEDAVLREAVSQCGVGNWTKVASLVPGRTQSQVRERWVNRLDEKICRSEWMEEEDQKLKNICHRYTGAIPWSAVAREMVTRTDYMCLMRWQAISDTSTVVKHYAESLKKKETIMTNFYGRENCKHTLSGADIEDDMIPESTRERMKTYGEKLARKKLRQAHYSHPSPLSLEAVDHVLHSYYNQIPQMPTETQDVRIFTTESELEGPGSSRGSKGGGAKSRVRQTSGRVDSESAWAREMVRPTTQVVSIAPSTDEGLEYPQDCGVSYELWDAHTDLGTYHEVGSVPRSGESSGGGGGQVMRGETETAATKTAEKDRRTRRRSRSNSQSKSTTRPSKRRKSGGSKAPAPSDKNSTNSLALSDRGSGPQAPALASVGHMACSSSGSWCTSSIGDKPPDASDPFPRGRFLVVPHPLPPSSPTLGTVAANAPVHLPSNQSLQGMYAHCIVTDRPQSAQTSTSYPVHGNLTPATSTQSIYHRGTPSLGEASDSSTTDPARGNMTPVSTHDSVNESINRGSTHRNEESNISQQKFAPECLQMLMDPKRSSPSSRSSQPLQQREPQLSQPTDSPGSIGTCIGRAINTLLRESSCSGSGDDASVDVAMRSSTTAESSRTVESCTLTDSDTATVRGSTTSTAASASVVAVRVGQSGLVPPLVSSSPLGAVSSRSTLSAVTTLSQSPSIALSSHSPTTMTTTASPSSAVIHPPTTTRTTVVYASIASLSHPPMTMTTTALPSSAVVHPPTTARTTVVSASTTTTISGSDTESPIPRIPATPIFSSDPQILSSAVSIASSTTSTEDPLPSSISETETSTFPTTQSSLEPSTNPLYLYISHLPGGISPIPPVVDSPAMERMVSSLQCGIHEGIYTGSCLVAQECLVWNGEDERMIVRMENPKFKNSGERVQYVQSTQRSIPSRADTNTLTVDTGAEGSSQRAEEVNADGLSNEGDGCLRLNSDTDMKKTAGKGRERKRRVSSKTVSKSSPSTGNESHRNETGEDVTNAREPNAARDGEGEEPELVVVEDREELSGRGGGRGRGRKRKRRSSPSVETGSESTGSAGSDLKRGGRGRGRGRGKLHFIEAVTALTRSKTVVDNSIEKSNAETDTAPGTSETPQRRPARAAKSSPKGATTSPKITSTSPRTTTRSPKTTARATARSPRSGATTSPKTTATSQRTTSKSPKTTTKSPNITTKSPKTATKSPKTATKSPKTTSKSPKTTTKSPKTTSKSPKTTTKSPKTRAITRSLISGEGSETLEESESSEESELERAVLEYQLGQGGRREGGGWRGRGDSREGGGGRGRGGSSEGGGERGRGDSREGGGERGRGGSREGGGGRGRGGSREGGGGRGRGGSREGGGGRGETSSSESDWMEMLVDSREKGRGRKRGRGKGMRGREGRGGGGQSISGSVTLRPVPD